MSTHESAAPRIRAQRKTNWGRIAAWAAMGLLLFVSLFPFFWMIRTALSTNADLITGSQSLTPDNPTLLNVRQALGTASTDELTKAGTLTSADVNFFTALRNSVIVCTLITIGQVTFCSMAAYAFARLKFPGRDKLFFLFLTAMMIPTIFTLLPNFVLIKQLGLVDNLLGIALPSMLMTPFAVFFLRQFFLGISREVEEAALVEGASKVRVFFRLILPMSSAPIATLGILTYIMSWNDYFWPLMVSYTDASRVLTVALGVFRAQSPQTGTDWAGLMAATLVAALPMLILFMAFARRIVNSIGFSGIK